ncbi:TlpA disulfide reductase family protein [Winogradskyella psychrotolerans]|uniref:TlpA disulfide reductase family protein n=1 Tax=Winogradskyella psychrotolerans TaxID=1344585 RepID=UPI001C06D573|nr:TlpA disulfide reductase family protein [Winogradskyella psychrotolerans]MBU2928257.1 AhpC/TSA family protein [Winogradskyella psychrotolerans]
MRNVFSFILIGLLFLGCKTEETRTDFIINGNAPGVYNGVRSYLKIVERNGMERVIDTAIVIDEKFSFTGKVLYPSLSSISVNSVNGKLNFMLENNIINIDINKANISQSEISGSSSQHDFKTYQNEFALIRKEAMDLKIQLRNYRANQTATKRDSIANLVATAEKQLQEFPINFIKNHTDSYYSLALIEIEASKNNAKIDDLLAAYNMLNSELKSSPKGVSVKINLDNLMVAYQKKSRVNIGKVAPNFTAPTPEGTSVSLNDVKGKVTIIDFWAAWCGPCRRENPNVVRIYNQYHDQGLEIIGVSLDGTRTQKDPKQTWVNAIEKDKLTWTHVSNLQYFQDPIAQLYNITAIPATFILDAEGKIVAKNLRGNALEAKVKELLKS